MLLFTLFALTLYSLPSNTKGVKSCDEQLHVADNCLKKVLYIGDWNLTLLRTLNDVKNHCSETKKNFACIRRYSRCLQGLPKDIYNILSKNAKKLYKERCETVSGREEFLSHAKCLDDESISINKCMDKTIEMLDYVSNNTEGERDTILRATCCAVQLGINCFREKIKGYCEEKTGTKTTEYLSKRVDSVLSDVLDLACSKYQNVKACDQVIPELMNDLRSVTEVELEKKSTSILIPLMSILKKIKF